MLSQRSIEGGAVGKTNLQSSTIVGWDKQAGLGIRSFALVAPLKRAK